MFHERIKHIEMDSLHKRDCNEGGSLRTHYVFVLFQAELNIYVPI